jgi:hypothetical protein
VLERANLPFGVSILGIAYKPREGTAA